MDTQTLSVAVIVSGHPRTWKRGCRWVNEYLRPRFKDTHVYAHLWDTLDAERTWHKTKSPNKNNKTPIKDIVGLLSPVHWVVESIDKKEFHRPYLEKIWKQSPTTPANILSQWYSTWRAWEMVPNNYDIIIRHRLDCEATFFVIHTEGLVIGCRPIERKFCDAHAYGCYEAMEKYCSLYPIADTLLKPKICGHKGRGGRLVLSPEMALREALRGVDVYKDPQYKRVLHRMDGSVKEL